MSVVSNKNSYNLKTSINLGKNKLIHRIKKESGLILLCLPAVLLIFIFNYLPMPGLILAFKNFRIGTNFFDAIFNSEWVGFKNFMYLFTSGDALRITRNTLVMNLLFIFIGTACAILFALMLNELKSRKLLKIYQTAFFFPYFLSWVVVSYMVYAIISEPSGVLTGFLMKQFNIQQIGFYSKPELWPFILLFVYIWKSIGYTSLILYSGILGISDSYYEAAEIDGATRVQMVFKITIPLLRPLIIVIIMLGLGKIFFSDFGLFYFVPQNSGILYPTTDVIDTYVYRSLSVTGDIGMSTAAGCYQSVVGFVTILLANLIVKKISPEEALF